MKRFKLLNPFKWIWMYIKKLMAPTVDTKVKTNVETKVETKIENINLIIFNIHKD